MQIGDLQHELIEMDFQSKATHTVELFSELRCIDDRQSMAKAVRFTQDFVISRYSPLKKNLSLHIKNYNNSVDRRIYINKICMKSTRI
jgi:hypothetical protein